MKDHARISVPHGQGFYQKRVFSCAFFKLKFKNQAKKQPKLRVWLGTDVSKEKENEFPVLSDLWK